MASKAFLQQAYLAYFGRPADPSGLAYYAEKTEAQVKAAFSASPESQAFFGSMAVAAQINAIYQNLFNRDAEPAGLTYWAQEIGSGRLSLADAAMGILAGAQNDDKTAVANKLAASDSFTTALNTTAEILGYAGAAAIAPARAYLKAVDATAATLTTAVAGVDASVTTVITAGSAVAGQTFTLTTGADNFTGTSGNDTINAFIGAANSTLTGADIIDGGAGTDTLNLNTDNTGTLSAASITNVEIFKIRDVGAAATYNFATVSGENSVINNISTSAVTLSAMAAGTALTIKGDGTTTNGATTFTMAAATDAVNLTIDGGVTAGAITRNATGAATVTVNSTGAANTIGVLDLDTATAVKGLTINAATNLTGSLAADYAASSSLTVTGAATKVDLSGAALSANITKVDASGMTAGGVLVAVDQTDTTVDTQFIGGAGNDTLDIGKVVYNSTTLTAAGGNGTDTLKMSDQAALTSTTAKYISGFETLSLYDDNDGALDTFDASLLSGITGVSLAADSAGDGYAVTNLSAAQAANITITGSNNNVGPTLTIKDATTVGNLDTLSVAINDGATAVSTLTLANLTSAGAETINFALTDNLTLSSATGLTALTKIGVTGAGALNLTTGALALNVNSTIDASASTGTVTIDASAGTTNGLAIKGSSTKANTITGTNQDDVITGGTGVDTVKNQANAATDSDTVDFVSDSAADIFEVTTLTGKTTITNFDVATTTTTEDLVNVSNDSADGAETQITAAAAQALIGSDKTIVIEQTVGAAASLTTGGTATLAAADFTAATLTNVAAFLSERFTGDNDTLADETAVIIMNNGTNSYMYAYADSTTANTTIDASELTLIGVFNGAILNAGDVYQTV